MATGRVEPATPIELTTSWTEVPQARWSCASSPEAFTQPILHSACPKTRGPERGSIYFQIFLESRDQRLQLASSSFSPLPRRRGQELVPNNFMFRTSRSGAKSTKSSLDELRRFACEAEAAPHFCRWYATSVFHA